MNPKWVLYLMASINKHFEANISSDSDLKIALFYEGLCRTDVQNDAENLVEVRCTGPFWKQQGRDKWQATIIINCAVQSVINDSNNYKIWRVIGKVNAAFADTIGVKNYEEGNNDPQTIGCLQFAPNKSDITNNFLGQIDPTVKRLQGEVSANYMIDLEDED